MLYDTKRTFKFFLISIDKLLAQKIDFVSNQLITYQFTYQPDSLDVNVRMVEIMNLYIGDNQSLYENVKWKEYDSIVERTRYTKVLDFDKLPKFSITHFIYKNSDSELLFADNFQIGRLKYFENLKGLNWQIKKEKKYIDDYLCQKAELNYGGRKFIAWFNSAIPINEGPYKFKNLPGLIFEVYDTNNYFNFKLVQIKNTEQRIIKNFDNYVKIDKAEYYPKKEKIYNSLYSKRNIQRKVIYNPIEKK